MKRSCHQGHHTGGPFSCYHGSTWHDLLVGTKLVSWTSGAQRCGLFSSLSLNRSLFYKFEPAGSSHRSSCQMNFRLD
ncbi:hypothetical protein VZT92_001619 [Zoarces viviparus]|uniref:Uncharacterized protein n=1 Tax=Zoarces viviparus TaxID=48416 RepID=A0AAW1G4N2_ZOAVI